MSIKKKQYVSVVYDEKRTPKTDYPYKLAKYLTQRFSLKEGVRLLEIGCGRGDFLTAFSKIGLDCFAVDREKECRDLLPGLVVKQCDISKESLPFEGDFFDIVYSKSILEHFYSPEKIMKETLRVLKPGGRVIILTPDWISQMKTFYEDFTHCRPYTVSALKDALEIFGFSDVHAELFYQYPAIWRYPVLKKISQLMRLFISTPLARKLTELTKIKYFRWSVELMVLGYAKK